MPDRKNRGKTLTKPQELSPAAAATIKKRKDRRFKKQRRKGFVWVT